MNPDPNGSIPPSLATRRAKVNLWIAVVAPFAIVAGAVGIFLVSMGDDPYAGAVATFFAVVGIVPVLAGFLVSLRWKTRHPGAFILIGLGMSAAVGCVWAGCVWGFCAFS